MHWLNTNAEYTGLRVCACVCVCVGGGLLVAATAVCSTA